MTVTIAPEVLAARAVDVMITRPKTLPAETDATDVFAEFADEHVHLLLLVRDGVLLGTIRRGDVPPGAAGAALPYARLDGRVVGPDDTMADVHPRLVATGLRRLAVVGDDGRLLGLLCLKRNGTGYCTDEGVAGRAAEGHPDRSPC